MRRNGEENLGLPNPHKFEHFHRYQSWSKDKKKEMGSSSVKDNMLCTISTPSPLILRHIKVIDRPIRHSIVYSTPSHTSSEAVLRNVRLPAAAAATKIDYRQYM